MFVEEGFNAVSEDTDPDLAGGFDEGDGSEVIEGDIFVFFGDWLEETPFPSGCTLPLSPEVSEVVVELELKVLGKGYHHVVGQP